MSSPADAPTLSPKSLIELVELPSSPPSPEWMADRALRLLASWDGADDPAQYVDDVRIDLALEIVGRVFSKAKEQTR